MKSSKKGIIGICVILGLVCIGFGVEATEKNSFTQVQYLSREEILNVNEAEYEEGTCLKWDEYRMPSSEVHDGIIPMNLLSDEIYCSMNLPSESRSDETIRMYRDNGMVMNKMSEEQSTLIGMGAIYKTTEKELPEKFTMCLGKIKTFAYIKDANNWVLIDEQPYPAGVYLYKMPWTEHSRKKCNDIKYYSDHIEIKMTDEEFEDYALHFWGKSSSVKAEQVLYVACAYDFWIKEEGQDGIFTATIGIDAKDAEGSDESIVQLFYSRGLEVTSEKRTHWGQTIPNDKYNPIYDGYILNLLYDKWWNVSK